MTPPRASCAGYARSLGKNARSASWSRLATRPLYIVDCKVTARRIGVRSARNPRMRPNGHHQGLPSTGRATGSRKHHQITVTTDGASSRTQLPTLTLSFSPCLSAFRIHPPGVDRVRGSLEAPSLTRAPELSASFDSRFLKRFPPMLPAAFWMEFRARCA